MDIFLSWSGETSKKLALEFYKWIPKVLQTIHPYMSEDKIEYGERGFYSISKGLRDNKYGLIFLTKDNITAPWINFEAGALSKTVEESRVIPMLFDVKMEDIQGPLTQFQMAKDFKKESIRKLITDLNNFNKDFKLESTMVSDIFETWWPELESSIQSVPTDIGKINTDKANDGVIDTEKEKLNEVLSIIRRLDMQDRQSSARKNNQLNLSFISEIMSLTQRNNNLIEELSYTSHKYNSRDFDREREELFQRDNLLQEIKNNNQQIHTLGQNLLAQANY